ncbi:MAG: hypothetical protein ACREMV_12230 [Gemmatimonadales bacterium]
MDDLEFLIPISLFVSVATVLVLRGPIGRALADRLSGRAGAGIAGPSDATMAELDELRNRVAELEERLDFAERRLAGSARLAPPAGHERLG